MAMSDVSQEQSVGARVTRWNAAWLGLFVVAGIIATLGESTYDMAFADTALTVSEKVTTIGWIYCAGYLTEALASATLGSRIDAWGPLRAMAIFAGAASVVLVAAGAANVLVGVTSVVVIVLTAALIDYLNQLVGIAHSAALPEAFGDDEQGLIRYSGVDSSVRSVAAVASPVVAGMIIIGVPGFSALLVVAGLYAVGYLLLIGFLVRVGRAGAADRDVAKLSRAGEDPAAVAPVGSVATVPLAAPQAGESQLAQPPLPATEPVRPSLRAVAGEILESPFWRRFLVVDVAATMALSAVLLLIYALFRHDFGFSPRSAGIVLGCMALGSLAASVVVAKGAKEGLSHLFGVGASCCGIGALVVALSGGRLVLAGAGAVLLGAGSVLQLKSMTLIVQLHAPKGRVGSWFAVIDTVELVVNAMSILAAAWVMDRLGGPWVFSFMGAVLLASGLWWLSIQRHTPMDPTSVDGGHEATPAGESGEDETLLGSARD